MITDTGHCAKSAGQLSLTSDSCEEAAMSLACGIEASVLVKPAMLVRGRHYCDNNLV